MAGCSKTFMKDAEGKGLLSHSLRSNMGHASVDTLKLSGMMTQTNVMVKTIKLFCLISLKESIFQ